MPYGLYAVRHFYFHICAKYFVNPFRIDPDIKHWYSVLQDFLHKVKKRCESFIMNYPHLFYILLIYLVA